MTEYTLLPEYGQGRKTVRPGDMVWVQPAKGRRFKAIVRELRQDKYGVTAEVIGGPPGHSAFRSFTIERVALVTQAR